MSEALEPGIGKLLASAREVKGMTTAEVADKLKLTARQIEALEAEEFEKLPAAVFVRGFIRNYARLVGLDADRLLVALGEAEGATQTITAPSEGVAISGSPLKRWLIYLVGGFSLFLLLVALLYQWLSQGEQTLVVEEPVPVIPAPVSPASVMPPPEAAPAPAIQAPATMPSAPPSGTPSAAMPAPNPAPAPAEAPRPATSTNAGNPYLTPAAPSASTAAPAARPAEGVSTLRFSASDESWVQVVDGAGKRSSQIIARGGGASFSGQPPFRVVVGNAAVVRMQYNEQNIDLRPFTGDKVARLTLE
jgi:cytoskeleton protein RodZ